MCPKCIVHICMYLYTSSVHVCICMYLCVHIQHIVCIVSMLYVSYVLAQAGTDAVTTSPKDPQLGLHPAGPTQVDPGQQPDHFLQPSVTHSRTRFGAPARAARVGGGSKASPGCHQWSPPTLFAYGDPASSPIRADLGGLCRATGS